ncbi:hypothetical protein NEOKW01_1169 [Nematocida sp. AWRm80]|nr:hypothetical protein NEOKW01_1169 [Nematocida sp. AWRm80]
MEADTTEIPKDRVKEYNKERHERYLRLKEEKREEKVVQYKGLNTLTAERVDWIEIIDSEDTNREYHLDTNIKLGKTIPRVLAKWTENNKVIIITTPRGTERAIDTVQEIEENETVVRVITKRILECLKTVYTSGVKSKTDINTITINTQGEVYVLSNTIWRELLHLEIEEQKEEERMYMVGLSLLGLGVGEYPPIETLIYTENMKEAQKETVQQNIIEWLQRIKYLCYKEVVMEAICSEYTARLIDEILSKHFFYPEDKMIEECNCKTFSYLSSEEEPETEFLENSLLLQPKKTETIYDQQGGVSVKASTVDKDNFTFQMHFFKTSKKVSFSFNKKEDTVESVVKEMEDEGLAEEQQIELIKAHMENLIEKIEEAVEKEMVDAFGRSLAQTKAVSSAESLNIPMSIPPANIHTPANTPDQKEANRSLATSKTTTPQRTSPTGTPSQWTNSPRNSPKEDLSSAREGSDEGEYPITECKDNQQISDFVQEVAAHVKRAKSTAETWNALLKRQDIKTVGELRMLIEDDWEMLGLPVFASRAMKNSLYGESYTPLTEKMLGVDETLKSYENEHTVEQLLIETADKHNRPDLLNDWLQKVKCQDIRTVGELKLLRETDWEHLELTVFSYRAIRNAVFRHSKCVLFKEISHR